LPPTSRHRETRLIDKDWRTRLPDDAEPTLDDRVVVRKGNPSTFSIGRTWSGLGRVIVPDPKTQEMARSPPSPHGYVIARGGQESEARDFLKALYDHAPFLVPAARAAGVAFAVEKKATCNSHGKRGVARSR